jgi:putative MATE family efflux protein
MDKSERMGSAPIGKLLWEFSVPATASMLVAALYSLTDRVFIGRGVGVDGIAAATAAFPFMIVGMAVGLLFSVGARSVASMALGAGNADRAREAVSRGTGAAFLASVAVSLLIWPFGRLLLSLFGAGPAIAEDARVFLNILLLGLPFQSAAMTASASLQVEGRPRTAFAVNLAGTALNVALAPLFIFGFHWGLVGAATATVISQIASLVLVLLVVGGKRSTLKLDWSRILPTGATTASGKLIAEEAVIGLPVFLVHLSTVAVLLAANSAIRPYGGDLALAVIGVINTVGMVVSYPIWGITNGAQPLFGYNYGARNWSRLRRLSILVALWTLILAAAAEAATVLAPEFFVGLFSDDHALAALGVRALRIFMIAFAVFPLGQVPMAYFQSTGRALPSGVLMISRNAVMFAAMLILPRWFGIDGVCLAGPAADLSTAAIGLVYLRRMRREIREGEGQEKAEVSEAA